MKWAETGRQILLKETCSERKYKMIAALWNILHGHQYSLQFRLATAVPASSLSVNI